MTYIFLYIIIFNNNIKLKLEKFINNKTLLYNVSRENI